MTRLATALFALFVALTAWVLAPAGLPDDSPSRSGGVGIRLAGPGPSAAWAQTASAEAALTAEDYDDWERIANRADQVLVEARASEAAFEALRQELARWRARFQQAQFVNDGQIETLADQIEALGPAPGEGESESAELAARRQELQAQYNELITPVRRAEEAHSRANGLILRVDHLIRERTQARLLERGPIPVLPANLTAGLQDLTKISRILFAEVSSSAGLSSDRTAFRNNLPQIILLVAVAMFLLLRGRRLLKRMVDRMLARRNHGARAIALAMIVSFGQVLLPNLGVILLVVALKATSMFGSSGEALLEVLPGMSLAFFGARWLGGQTFPRARNWPMTLDLSGRERRRGRFYFSSLGILVAAAMGLIGVRELFVLEVSTRSVLAFPVIVLTGICLAGVGRLLVSHAERRSERLNAEARAAGDPDEQGFLNTVVLFVGRGLLFFSVAGPIAALIGYTQLAVYCSVSPGLSLGLIAAIAFLARLSSQLFLMFTSASDTGRDAGVWPVLVNVAIVLASIPFFALIWGARPADLFEIWNDLREGFAIGETRISPSNFLVFLLVFLGGYAFTQLAKGVMRNTILPRTKLDPGAQKAMVSGLGYVGLFIAGLAAISVAGLDLSGLAIVAGALSVGVGFGLQNIVSNFVSGLILLIERPVTEGDWIEVGGIMGTVRKISVRATTVETFDRTSVVVPNSDFVTGQVTNWTRGNLSGRLILPVGVAYGTDTRKVAEILQEIAEAHPLVIVNPPPLVVFQGFGADALEFEIRVILRDINFGLGTRTALNHSIAERFAAEGIEIPYAQRDIWLRNPEALRGAGASPPPQPVAGPIADIRPDSLPEPPSEESR